MTPAEQAAKAIKDVTGWTTYQYDNGAGVAQGSQKPPLHLWYSDGEWVCALAGFPTATRSTPEAALEDVLCPYRAHIAALAADILPGWPRLEWTGQPYARTLCLVVGGFTERILTVYPERTVWTVSIDNVTGPQRTREAVLAAVAAHVESLALPCPLPPFPETPHD